MKISEIPSSRCEFIEELQRYSNFPRLHNDVVEKYKKIFHVNDCYEVIQYENIIMFFRDGMDFLPKGWIDTKHYIMKIEFENEQELVEVCDKITPIF